MLAKEFVPNKSNYQYGLFHQEGNSRYYISDSTIDFVVSKIDWKLTELEKNIYAGGGNSKVFIGITVSARLAT